MTNGRWCFLAVAILALLAAPRGMAQTAPTATPPAAAPAPQTAPTATPPAAAPAPQTAPSVPKATPAAPPIEEIRPETTSSAGLARIHLSIDRDHGHLELRFPYESWQASCNAPCDRPVMVDGRQARVAAPGMTPSNPFRISPGSGLVRLRVSGGPTWARTTGIALLAAGIPSSLAGLTLFGFGAQTERDQLRTAGVVTLAVSAVAVLTSLPLLSYGATSVYDIEGNRIAGARAGDQM